MRAYISWRNYLRDKWIYLAGKPEDFSLQTRIFHSACLTTLFVMIYTIPFSLVIGLYGLAGATFLLIALQYCFYWLSRHKGKTDLSRTVILLMYYTFFIFNYFSNSGIDGSGMLSFATLFFICVAITPVKQRWYWGTLISLSVLGILYVEFRNPEIVQQTYSGRWERSIDLGSTMVVYIVLIFVVMSFIISNYTKERNSAIQKASRLKKLNEQQNKLISIVSHDYNAPLRNIKQYLKMWRNQDMDQEMRELLEKEMIRITTDTQNLLLNLLSWSRNNLNDQELQLLPVAICDTLSDTLKVYRDIAEDKKVEIEVDIPENAIVTADFDMLEIVLRNLISNAVKYSNESEVVHIAAEQKGQYWEITVKDGGAGVDTETIPLLFNHSVHSTPGTKKEKGVGMGLSICKEFTEAMKGRIGYRQVNTKSCFFVAFPAAI